ncbi:hypothetical protein P7H22_20695 [Paenibacillus larvae]|nr:hypothetical protein [Paenibacillus larvae]MDT2242285.1 hypothetical protein [Paenibacillus larvae]
MSYQQPGSYARYFYRAVESVKRLSAHLEEVILYQAEEMSYGLRTPCGRKDDGKAGELDGCVWWSLDDNRAAIYRLKLRLA